MTALQVQILPARLPFTFEETMQSYLTLLADTYSLGKPRGDRTGTGTYSRFGVAWEHDLRNGFPLLTTKKLHWKSIITEAVFFLQGHMSNNWLNERGVTIWDEWADAHNWLGPIYGAQWNRANSDGQSQLEYIEWALRKNPECRRMICCAWNWAEMKFMALPPCHVLWQVYTEDDLLHMQVYQRSADIFLGVPFNIASYGAILTALAACHGYQPARLRFNFGDIHVYQNHTAQVQQQLTRDPMELPTLNCNRKASVRELDVDDFQLHNYKSHPSIKAEVSK